MLHREPGKFGAIGRECRIGVISHHTLGEIAGGRIRKIVDIQVGIGGDGIFFAFLLAGSIDYAL